MSRERTIKEKLYWGGLKISTGEFTFEELSRWAGITVDGGSLVRSPHLRLEHEFGDFEKASSKEESRKIANFIREFCSKNYGFLGEAWLRYLVKNKSFVEQECKTMVESLSLEWGQNLTAQACRGSGRFALVASTLRLVKECFGLTWLQCTDDLCKDFFLRWVSELNLAQDLEETKTLDGLTSFLAKHQSLLSFFSSGTWIILRDCIGAPYDEFLFLFSKELRACHT